MNSIDANDRSALPGTSINSIIASNKDRLREIFHHSYSDDDSLLFGTLSLLQSRCESYILDRLALIDSQKKPDDKFPSAQNIMADMSPEDVIDHVWLDIHHPSFKYFQKRFIKEGGRFATSLNSKSSSNRSSRHAHSSNSKKHSSSIVETRKLLEQFVRFVGRCRDFYIGLLRNLLSKYNISIYIPVAKLCYTLKLDEPEFPDDQNCVPTSEATASIIYVVYKCVLYIGDLSRYRTYVAKTYLPSTALSKEDNNNYSKSIELYKLSLLILPSFGDPYNHIAIIDNAKGDKFNVVYNFIRSSMTSSPLTVGFNNLINLLAKQPKQNQILKNFESHNRLNRSTITKNDRMELLKSQFLVLLNYYFLPSKWKMKEGFLVKGHNVKEIEDNFYQLLGKLDFHKQIFNDLYFKQLAILTGAFEMVIDRKMSHPDLKQTPQIISSFLDYIFRYLLTLLKVVLINWERGSSSPSISTTLLPAIRLMLCWFKERELAKFYLLQNLSCVNGLAQIFNNTNHFFKSQPEILDRVEDNSYKKLLEDGKLFDERPTRRRLFKEDVTLKEFKPINFYLSDFNDDHLYERSETATLALIGELPNESHKSMKLNDNMLRLIAMGTAIKELVLENKVGVTFEKETGFFNIKGELSIDIVPAKATEHNAESKQPHTSNIRKRKSSARNSHRIQKSIDTVIKESQGLEDSLFNAEAGRTNTERSADVGKYVSMVSSLIDDHGATVASKSKENDVKAQLPSVMQSYNLLSNSIWSNGLSSSASGSHDSNNDSTSVVTPTRNQDAPSSRIQPSTFDPKSLYGQYGAYYTGNYPNFGMPAQQFNQQGQQPPQQPSQHPASPFISNMMSTSYVPGVIPGQMNLNMNMAMNSMVASMGSINGVPQPLNGDKLSASGFTSSNSFAPSFVGLSPQPGPGDKSRGHLNKPEQLNTSFQGNGTTSPRYGKVFQH